MAIPIVGLALRFGPSLAVLKAKFTLLTVGIALVAIIALICIRYFRSRTPASTERETPPSSPVFSAPASLASVSTQGGPTDAELFEKMVKVVKKRHQVQNYVTISNCQTSDFLKVSFLKNGLYSGEDNEDREFILVKGLCRRWEHELSFEARPYFIVVYFNNGDFFVRIEGEKELSGQFDISSLFGKGKVLETLQTFAFNGKVELVLENSKKVELFLDSIF
jgi:hypothetical protein